MKKKRWMSCGRSLPIIKPFAEYLNRKASLLGLERLNWYDVDAPIGEAPKEYTFDEVQSDRQPIFDVWQKLSAFTEKRSAIGG